MLSDLMYVVLCTLYSDSFHRIQRKMAYLLAYSISVNQNIMKS